MEYSDTGNTISVYIKHGIIINTPLQCKNTRYTVFYAVYRVFLLIGQAFRFALSCSVRSVRSQVRSRSVRPKWP